jgi:hypothetical protein
MADTRPAWFNLYRQLPLCDVPRHLAGVARSPYLMEYLKTVLCLCPRGERALETGVGLGGRLALAAGGQGPACASIGPLRPPHGIWEIPQSTARRQDSQRRARELLSRAEQLSGQCHPGGPGEVR